MRTTGRPTTALPPIDPQPACPVTCPGKAQARRAGLATASPWQAG